MAGIGLLGQTERLLSRALDAESLRHEVYSHNLANINTPGYKRQEVEFKDYLTALTGRTEVFPLRRTRPRHIDGRGVGGDSRLRVVVDRHSSMRSDGNNVDIDREMVALTEAATRYQVLAEQLGRRLRQLRTIINNRG